MPASPISAARADTSPPEVKLEVTTAEVDASDLPADLTDLLPLPTSNLAFILGGDGLVGWGAHAALTVTGPDAAAQIHEWFAGVVRELNVPAGRGPVAFVSMGFEDDDRSVAVVPAVLVERRDGTAFRTSIGRVGEIPSVTAVPIHGPGALEYRPSRENAYTEAVSLATEYIRAGKLDKVVLAQELHATAARDIDERYVLRRLASGYPTCWTYAVGGLVGSSPEMLIRREGAQVMSRVLAGTAWGEASLDVIARRLLGSAKDLAEHGYAVASVAQALAPVAGELSVPESPRPLPLSNLTHLATDITGVLRGGSDSPSALELAALLHPSAAVGGTPTSIARQVIRELEGQPRGRYAGPVGWIDASGDGEFAIALRGAQISGRSVRMLAGCGIVADSDPAVEAVEAKVKMIPIKNALAG